MAFVSEQQLSKDIRESKLYGAYFFFGTETYLLGQAKRRLLKKLLGSDDDTFNFHRFDGKNLDTDRLTDCAQTLPFLGQYQCILIDDFNPEKLVQAQMEIVSQTLGDLPPQTVLILTNTSDGLSMKRSAKVKKFVDAHPQMCVCEFGKKSPADASRAIMEAVSRCGLSISQRAAQEVADRCLNDFGSIHNEIEKLIAYRQEGEITREDVGLLVVRQIDRSIYDLAKAVLAKNVAGAMGILDELYFERVEDTYILSSLSAVFIDLYRAKLASAYGVPQAQAADDFTYRANVRFRLTNAFRDAAKYPLERLRAFLAILSRADEGMKASRTPPRVLMEETIVSMMLLAMGEAV